MQTLYNFFVVLLKQFCRFQETEFIEIFFLKEKLYQMQEPKEFIQGYSGISRNKTKQNKIEKPLFKIFTKLKEKKYQRRTHFKNSVQDSIS